MARLDRLAPVKEVAQIGACIGREFSDELMALLSPLPRAELDKVLGQLTASELMFKRGGGGKDTVYVFKHALVQDAAYDLLLKSKRVELHGKIARTLEEHFPAIKDNEPELLTHHYTEAGLTDLGNRLLAQGRRVGAPTHGAERSYRPSRQGPGVDPDPAAVCRP